MKDADAEHRLPELQDVRREIGRAREQGDDPRASEEGEAGAPAEAVAESSETTE